jgi:hypothetical protein
VTLFRRLAAAVVALAVLAPAPVTAQEDPADNVVRVDVRALTAALVPGVTDGLVIRARAVNTGTDPLRRLRVGLRFGQRLRGRSSIAAGGAPARLGTRVADARLGDGELAGGATGEVDFDVALRALPFGRATAPGVFPLRIEVRNGTGVVGAVDTFVMWWPKAAPKVRLAWVWPLAEPSHRGIRNDFFDDGLAGSVSDGRLDGLLAIGAASRVPLTWAVDPELLDAVHRMTTPYTVLGHEGAGTTAARTWLERARAALRGATVLPLPYADPDLATTATGALAADAGRAFQLGREVLKRELGTTGNSRLAWPPGSALDPAVEALLSGQGVKGVVVPETALPLADQLNYTPTAPTPLASGALGSMTALVTDAQLNGFVADPEREAGPRLAAQRFLADTAMIALERPGDLRDVVITPPRTWEPPVRDFAAQLLDQSAAAPWIQAVGLGDLLGDEPSAAARTRAPGNGGVLAPDHVRRLLDTRRLLQRVRGILTDPKRAPEELAELDNALLRAASAEWRDGDPRGRRLIDTVAAAVRQQLGKLRVTPGGLVVMTGRSGRIPLTFKNDLGQPVRVKVRLNSNRRLELDRKDGYERGREVVIPPGQSTLTIKGRATTGGVFKINVQLLGTDGQPLGTGTTVSVRSTAYGAVALGVTGVAFALLLVASATRLVRRRRRAVRPDPA